MRLFVGLEPAPELRAALSGLQTQLRSAKVSGRFPAPSNLHLTLAFIGEWPEDVTEVLPGIREPFPVTLSHLGIFPRAKVLWAGVRPSPELDALAAEVRERLDASGIPYDRQRFHPHITLVRKPAPAGGEVLSAIEVPPASMTVREVCLYRSEHLADGMKYTVIGRSKGER